MAPKTKMTPEEVVQKIADEPVPYCLSRMQHYVNGLGECPCGTFRKGDGLAAWVTR